MDETKYIKRDGYWVKKNEEESKIIPYFCSCKKIMRPFDSYMYEKIGMCLDCESEFDTFLKVNGFAEELTELTKIVGKIDERNSNIQISQKLQVVIDKFKSRI
jgi:hypothetical protein